MCGRTLEHRKDDTPEGVHKRLEVFKQETFPVIEHYRWMGKLLNVNALLSVEGSYAEIEKGLNDRGEN